MQVLITEADSFAKMTFSTDSADHQFEVWQEGEYAYVEHQESQTWRGQIRGGEPHESVYNDLMQSEAMTEYLDKHSLQGVRKADPSLKYSQ